MSKPALGAASAVALIAGLIVLAAQLNREEDLGRSDRAQPEAIAGIDIPGTPPLNDGTEVSMGDAVSQFAVPIYRPDTAAASDDTVRDVWIRGGDNAQVYVRYRSGLILTVRPAAGRPSLDAWADELIGDGVDGSIEQIAGVEAFVVHPELPSLGSVRFFLRDSLVVIVGDGEFPIEDLRAAASSAIGRANVVEAERQTAA